MLPDESWSGGATAPCLWETTERPGVHRGIRNRCSGGAVERPDDRFRPWVMLGSMQATPIATGPLLIGYDGSSSGRDALALGGRLAGALRLPIDVVSILEFASVSVSVEASHAAVEKTRGARRREAAAVLGDAAFDFRCFAHPSSTAAIYERAEDADASIIVVGSSRRGPVGRVLPGSTAERLLSAGPAAVAVAPRGYAQQAHDLLSVGVAYDGSPDSRQALAAARRLARGAGVGLRVLAVVSPAPVGSPVLIGLEASGTYGPEIEQAERKRLEAMLDDALADAGEDESLSSEVRSGPLAPTVIGWTGEGLDLLVMGSRGYGPLRRVLLGSVSSAVIREAECPVLVVPRGSRRLAAAPQQPDPAGSTREPEPTAGID